MNIFSNIFKKKKHVYTRQPRFANGERVYCRVIRGRGATKTISCVCVVRFSMVLYEKADDTEYVAYSCVYYDEHTERFEIINVEESCLYAIPRELDSLYMIRSNIIRILEENKKTLLDNPTDAELQHDTEIMVREELSYLRYIDSLIAGYYLKHDEEEEQKKNDEGKFDIDKDSIDDILNGE